MTQLTLNLPDELACRLAAREEDLPSIIERGLERIEASSAGEFGDLRDVLERLAALPSPAEVLQLKASARLQSRIGELFDKNRTDGLSAEEEREFALIEWTEHLVRTAKGRAMARLKAE